MSMSRRSPMRWRTAGSGRDARAVAEIVGRDPSALDEAGVARAAIESLAENFSDGVVAPALLPRALRPAGRRRLQGSEHRRQHDRPSHTTRHGAFGFAAARFDDLVNLPASRLSALWLALAAFAVPGASPAEAMRAALRDAKRHRSPNAGWPEAAMAGALGLKLAGPRVYDGVTVEDAFMGDGRARRPSRDIRRALRLYRAACAIQIAVYALFAALLIARA